jgi:hypothetical protein
MVTACRMFALLDNALGNSANVTNVRLFNIDQVAEKSPVAGAPCGPFPVINSDQYLDAKSFNTWCTPSLSVCEFFETYERVSLIASGKAEA